MLKKIFIEGMSCNHCVNHVKEALAELKDSGKIQVNEEVKEKIEDQGYDVVSIELL